MKSFILLTAAMFTYSLCANAGEVASGFIFVKPNGECQIAWGQNLKGLNCRSEFDSVTKSGKVVVDYSSLKMQLPPICVVSAIAVSKRSGEVAPSALRIGTFNTATLEIFVENTTSAPLGPIANMICTLPDTL